MNRRRGQHDLGPPPLEGGRRRHGGRAEEVQPEDGVAPPAALTQALVAEGEAAAAAWREDTGMLPRLERTLGSAGVYGDPWDTVEVLVDNARMRKNVSQEDGVLSVSLSTSAVVDAVGTAYVWRRLAAARSCRVLPFSWPTVPEEPKAMMTNRAEVSILIRELATRAPASDVGIRHHFRGRLSTWETAALLFYRGVVPDAITEAISRSIAAQAQFYGDTIQMQPPVNIDTLSLEIRRGERLVNFRPFRLTVAVVLDALGDTITRVDGQKIELEQGQEVVFESDVVDAAGLRVYQAGRIAVVGADSTGAAATLATGGVGQAGAAGTCDIAVPARRVQIAMQFSVARIDDKV